MDALAGGEAALAAGPAHDQRLRAPRGASRCATAASSKKATWRHWRGAKSLPIRRFEVAQRVAVEGRGDAERVVVGGLEDGARLDQVDADQEAAAAGAGADAAQEGERLVAA